MIRHITNQRFHHLRVPLHRQNRGALLDAIVRTGDDRDYLPAVRQAEPDGERAVVAELHRFALQRDMRVAVGGAVDDDFGVDGEFQGIAFRWLEFRAEAGAGVTSTKRESP